MKLTVATLAILLLATLPLRAQEHAPTTAPAHAEAAHAEATHAGTAHEEADTQPHPVLSQDSSWAGVMVIIALGMFLMAAVIGPIVRANMPAEVPQDHSHDDHSDTSGHHGGGHGHGGHGH